MDEPNLEDRVEPRSSEKTNEIPLVPGMEKFQQLMPTMPSNTLLEKSAQALAEAWTRDNDLLPDLCDASLQSEMGIIFKIQVAIYLKGLPLIKWIQSQNGLESLANRVWPDLLQKLLATIFYEKDRWDQRISIQNSLKYILEDYQKSVRNNPDLPHALHRLGLTSFFPQGKITYEDNLTLFYYWYLQDRSLNFRGIMPMVYPLPYVLQSRWPKINDFREAFYVSSPTIQQKKREWSRTVTAQEMNEENEGKTISSTTSYEQKALYEAYCETYTPSERFMSCISVMARSHVNGSYPVVLMAALLSLVHPFYSGKHELGYPTLRMFRIDIFTFLACALCSFYAQLDLPLVCLFMAQQSIGPVPCLSERMRYALCYQTIAVHYGHWQAAAKVFKEWIDRVPPISWLYEEMIYNTFVGLLWRMENLLVEMYIDAIFHKACGKRCREKHVNEPLSTLLRLNEKMNSIAIYLSTRNATQKNFQENLQIVFDLHRYFNITIKKIEKNSDILASDFDSELYQLAKYLNKQTEFNCSRHLTPFREILPSHTGHHFFWKKMFERITDTSFRRLQSFSLLDTPKTYADRLFSLVVSLLYHNRHQPFTHVIQATLSAYLKSTAGRHYRIPLLRKLLQVYKDPLLHQINLVPIEQEDDDKNDPHPDLPLEKLTAINMTFRDIEAFSFTAKDARNDFAHAELSSDEKFIMYMKQRDPLMPAWMDCGLDCIRFADCL